jgi:anti-sigma-K factor RskA
MATEPTMTDADPDLDAIALEALAEAYAMPPPPRLRGRLLAAVAVEREQARASRRMQRARLVGAAAAAVALVLAGLLARELERAKGRSADVEALTRQNQVLAARLEEQGRTLAGVRDAMEAQTQILRLVGGPRVMSATLAPQGGRAGTGRVLVDTSSGSAGLVLTGLAPAPEGKTYELWAIRGSKPPEPAGLVKVDPQHGVAMSVPTLAAPSEITAFAVSIEPLGGSSAPTGPVVLVGAVPG